VGPTGQPLLEADKWGPLSGRIKENGKGLGSVLGPKAVGPAGGPTRLGLAPRVRSSCGSAGRLGPWAGWVRRPAQTNRPAHGSLPSLSLSDNTDPGGSAPRFPRQAGPAYRSPTRSGVAARSGVAQARVAPCACVPECVCVWLAQSVFGEMPQGLGRDVNATSRPGCVVAAHGEAVVGSWRVMVGLGSV
jgi:hypothetical protein